jgi:hypothetical protein
MENKDLPAYPTIDWDQLESGQIIQKVGDPGLTKLELVASGAMNALIGNWDSSCKICDSDPRYDGQNFKEVVAINAAEFAHALLAELSKPQP